MKHFIKIYLSILSGLIKILFVLLTCFTSLVLPTWLSIEFNNHWYNLLYIITIPLFLSIVVITEKIIKFK